MKKIFALTIAFLASFGILSAQEYDMSITLSNGDVTTMRVKNLSTLAVAGEDDYLMTITKNDGTQQTFSVQDVEKITYAVRPDNNEGWTSLGYCLYGEDFLASTVRPMGTDIDYFCCDYYVEVQEKDSEPGLYRLVNPYSPDIYPYAYYTTYDSENDYYIEFNATDPDAVYVELQDTGMSWSTLGRFYVYSMGMYYYEILGMDWATIKRDGCFGTLRDGVITFPYFGLATLLPSYSTENFFYANASERFKIDLNDKSDVPGVVEAKALTAPRAAADMDNIALGEAVPAARSTNK